MNLLHLVATPREHESNTLSVAAVFLEGLQAKYPALKVDSMNLFNQDLSAVAGENIETKYTLMVGQPIDKRLKESWQQIEALIARFQAADVYLISSPMWNFSVPYALKYYIDAIVQPGYLYKYNERGQPVPLTLGKKMVCITSRGGDYSEHSPFQVYDFQEPYLRAIFGFVGITDIQFINAQPMDITLSLRESALARAQAEAASLAAGFQWNGVATIPVPEQSVALKPKPLP
jgi:FMN-dependent NADH-azoreductase